MHDLPTAITQETYISGPGGARARAQRGAALRACAHATGIRDALCAPYTRTKLPSCARHATDTLETYIRSIRLLVVVDKLLDESLLEQHSDLRHLLTVAR